MDPETNPLRPSLSSRLRGSLYGLAITDALGGPVEFQPRGSFSPVTTYAYNSNFDLPPGAWTDDTSMTLCLGQSLVDKKGRFDVKDQVQKYVDWKEKGYMSCTGSCFDIGNATREALGIWKLCLEHGGRREGPWREGEKMVDKKMNRVECCGNGSLMRCVPVPLVFFRDPQEVERFLEVASGPTHPHRTCVEACQVYGWAVGEVLRREAGKEALFEGIRVRGLESAGLRGTFEKYGSLEDMLRTEQGGIKSSGFVVHTLEAALWAFFTTNTFREGALRVVNLGDDADTVGAVYGGLAGAFYGFEEISGEWVEGLYAKGMIDDVVEGLVRLVREREAVWEKGQTGDETAADGG